MKQISLYIADELYEAIQVIRNHIEEQGEVFNMTQFIRDSLYEKINMNQIDIRRTKMNKILKQIKMKKILKKIDENEELEGEFPDE